MAFSRESPIWGRLRVAVAYLGEIRIFGFGQTPPAYLPCEGQLLDIGDYIRLFNVIGTTFGGDGITTFALPDMRGRIVLGTGSDAQGNDYPLGTSSGQESVVLNAEQMPQHTHAGRYRPPPAPQAPTRATIILPPSTGPRPSPSMRRPSGH